MTNCLLVGSRGMLGSYLAGYLPAAPPSAPVAPVAPVAAPALACLDLPDIDITDARSVAAAFSAHCPSVVINCAAYTDVDGAEANRDLAMRVNADGPGILARHARARGALLVHISTDFVFDGAHPGPYRETDAPNPLNVYGASKLAGEEAIRAETDNHLIIRTAWLYGHNGRNFVDTILRLASERGHLNVVDDQAGSPTFTAVLSEYLHKLVQAGARGTYHVAGSGVATWYDLASEAVRLAGLSATVSPVTTAEFPRPARRPRNSSLDPSKAERLLGEFLPPWRLGLRRYITDNR